MQLVQRIKQNELGRSMVEILGVLAVIGVLSIGGIQGYKYAMDKHRANDIVNEVNMRATDIWHLYQDAEKELPDSSDADAFPEYGEKTQTGFDIMVTSHPPVAFRTWVDNVPSDVCKKVLQENLNEAITGLKFVQVDSGGGLVRYDSDINICGEGVADNQMVFTSFLDEGGGAIGTPTDEEGRPLPPPCVDNDDCISACGEAVCDEDTQRCINNCDGTDKPYCVDDVCVECMTDEDCINPDKPVCNASHTCEPCPYDKPIYNETTHQCEACPSETPIRHNDECVECVVNPDCKDTLKPVCNGKNVCEPCPFLTSIYHDDKCVECVVHADCQEASKPVCSEENVCEPCPNDKPKYNATTGECETCPSDKPYWYNGQCVECMTYTDCKDTSKPTCDSNKICSPCSDDKPYWYNGQCNTCPEGAFWSDEHNGCLVGITLTSEMTDSGGLTPQRTSILTLTFPSTITAGAWKVIGTDIKATLDATVKLGYCSQKTAHFDLTDNIVDLDDGSISGHTRVEHHIYPCIPDTGLGQNLVAKTEKADNTVIVTYYAGSLSTATIKSSVEVYTSSIQAVLQ